MSTDEQDGMVVARVTIERRLTDDDLVYYVTATDDAGDEMPFADALGMLRLAEHTLIQNRLHDDEENE